jgi:hypothetical protein
LNALVAYVKSLSQPPTTPTGGRGMAAATTQH